MAFVITLSLLIGLLIGFAIGVSLTLRRVHRKHTLALTKLDQTVDEMDRRIKQQLPE